MELILLKPLLDNKLKMDVNETFKALVLKKFKALCWGITTKANVENKGLLVKVRGNKFKHWVLVTLNGMDYYEVDFVKSDGTVVKHLDMVDCMDLCDMVDDYIERLDSYVR